MLELYWAYTDYRELMELIERLLHGLADSLFGSRRGQLPGARLRSGQARSGA